MKEATVHVYNVKEECALVIVSSDMLGQYLGRPRIGKIEKLRAEGKMVIATVCCCSDCEDRINNNTLLDIYKDTPNVAVGYVDDRYDEIGILDGKAFPWTVPGYFPAR